MRRPSDLHILYATTFLRSLSIAASGILLGLYLRARGLGDTDAGLIIAAGLAGGAVAALAATFLADAFGRRRSLVLLALLAGAIGAAFALVSGRAPLALAAFFGFLNGQGRDRGASLVIEQAILPSTTTDERRTRSFAWFSLLQDAGGALGGALATLPTLLRRLHVADQAGSLSLTLLACAVLVLVTAVLYLGLSDRVELAAAPSERGLSPEGRRTIAKLSAIFSVDSLGGGFLATSFLALFFHERYAASEAAIGALFVVARVLNALSHPAAAWIARRIGLVNTIVFTHMPSSVFLMIAVVMPSFPLAALFFLLRESLVQMDVPTRTSYMMAILRPEERTVASGTASLVRLGAWAVAPSFAGLFMERIAGVVPFFCGAGIKMTYDVLLFFAFRRTKPPEERQPR